MWVSFLVKLGVVTLQSPVEPLSHGCGSYTVRLLIVKLQTLCLCPDLKSPPPHSATLLFTLSSLIKAKTGISGAVCVWGRNVGGKAQGRNDRNAKTLSNTDYEAAPSVITSPFDSDIFTSSLASSLCS